MGLLEKYGQSCKERNRKVSNEESSSQRIQGSDEEAAYECVL